MARPDGVGGACWSEEWVAWEPPASGVRGGQSGVVSEPQPLPLWIPGGRRQDYTALSSLRSVRAQPRATRGDLNMRGREAHQLPSARPRTLKAAAAVPSEAGGLRAGGGAAAVGPGFPSLRGRSPDVKGRRRRRPRPFCSFQALSGSDEALCWGGGRLYRVCCLKCPSLPGTPSQTPPEM